MKMAKMGKTPTLVCGSAGKSEFVIAKWKRPCSRCGSNILKGENCVEVKKPGGGHRTYCLDCYQQVIEQSQKDLDKIKKQFEKLKK